MRLITSLDAIDPRWLGGVVTVGNFDGVHQGHRQIIQALTDLAQQVGGPSLIFSFDPHPLALLKPTEAPKPLCWAQRKAELLGELGVDALVAYPTDQELLQLDYRQFFQQVIVGRLEARGMVEGPNFFFGRDRQGTVERLKNLCDQADMELRVVPLRQQEGQIISSSRIRTLVAAGQIELANELLTSPYQIRGKVDRGDQRGRQLGFPTANLVDCPVLVPGSGIYACRAQIDQQTHVAAVHIGPNPTFGVEEQKVEVHLLDYEGDLYGSLIQVEFHYRLRDVRSFESVDRLKRQLEQDVATVKERMSESSS